MTARQKRIWDLLVGGGFLTAKDIGQHLVISDRTVRNDIKEINEECGKEVILSKKGQGYYIVEQEPFWDMRAEQELAEEESLEWEILRRVLFADTVPYLELADELYISDTLLSKVISRINRRMTRRYGKGTILKRGGTLVMELSEEERRDYYGVYITTRNQNQFFEPESFEPYFQWVDIPWMKELLLETFGSCRHQLFDFDATFMRMVVGSGIMAERMAAGYFVSDSGQGEPEEMTCRIMKALEKKLGISAPLSEYWYLENLFRNDFYYMKEEDNYPAREIVDEILMKISLEYGYDFSGDEEFCQEMMAQVIGAMGRTYHKQLKLNPILSRIRSQYPLEYDMAVFFADKFQRLTNCKVGEDEVGFFAIHIIRAMEARMVRTEKKVALVNPFGKQVKELIRKRLEEIGECRLKISVSYSLFELPQSLPKDILAVLTTVPLQTVFEEVPVILCRNFLDYREKEKLLTIVREEQVSSVRRYIKRLFHPSLFFTDMEFDSSQEVLTFLCRKLKDQGYVNEDFLNDVLEREKAAPTVFETGFAVAHAMENTAIRSAVSVCILKDKIPWGDMSVKMVFLLALAPGWNQNMIPVYRVMIGSLMKAGTLRQLSRAKDVKTFVNILM